MTNPIRIGIIGCGSVASGPYRDIIQTRLRDHVQVTMTCDIKEARAKRLGATLGAQRTTTRYQDVLDSPDVDLVLVTTAMQVHGEIAKAGLKAGKHVLVEKPMSVHMAEADELVALQKKSAGLLVCAPHIVLSRTYQEMWRRIHGGEIGTPYTARARYGWSGPWWGQWFYEQGGGALFDLGVYNVTALTGWLGPAKRVTAMTGVVNPKRLVEGKTHEDRGRRQRACADRFWQQRVRGGQHRVFDAGLSQPGARNLRQHGHDPDDGRRLGARRV